MVIIIKRPFYNPYSAEDLLTISKKMNLAGNELEVKISVIMVWFPWCVFSPPNITQHKFVGET